MMKKKIFHTRANRKKRRFIHNENTPILTNDLGFTVLSSFPKAVCCCCLSNSPQRGYFNNCQLQLLNMFNTMFDYLVSWS